jgi:hypothetical protein
MLKMIIFNPFLRFEKGKKEEMKSKERNKKIEKKKRKKEKKKESKIGKYR